MVGLAEQAPLSSPGILEEPLRRQVFLQGLKAVSPLLIGILPFALITGSIAVSKGLTVDASIGFSLFIFAGASQLAALELIGNQAPFLIIILTVFMVNLRFLIYSAAIAPYFSHLPLRWKWLTGYLLSDQAFVVSHNRYEAEPKAPHRRYYYLGVGMGLWGTWQIGSVIGIFVGAGIPPSLNLDFAVPLSFIALLVPNMKDKASLAAGLSSAICVLLFASLPMNLGFILAVFVGIGTGVLVSRAGAS